MILAGDIGGTKTYLGLFDVKDGRPELKKFGSFLNSGFPGHLEIIEEFLKDGGGGLEAAAFGVAGTVSDDRCSMTNLSWVVDGGEIRNKFRIKKAGLLNDLVATAWGIDLLSGGDVHTLQEGKKTAGNAAVIAAGTGLGESILYWDGSSHIPLASEGGHADFAPRNPIETELLLRLAAIYGHVSYERVLSGRGLEDVYDFLRNRSGVAEPADLRKRIEAEGAAGISEEAMSGTDEVCRSALDLFISVYGAEAGNLALRVLPVGGLYVGGGIAVRILPALIKNNAFIETFRGKGRLGGVLSSVPVHVILNDKTGLLGAARYAARLG